MLLAVLLSATVAPALQAQTPAAALSPPSPADDEIIDVGNRVLDLAAIKDGLYPNEDCKELLEGGLFKCAGIKPGKRFALPGANFDFGSAELPTLLRRQLDQFAEVLRGKQTSSGVIRIEGHTDAVGTPEANRSLSQRRADAVKTYLVQHGVSADILQPIGVGAQHLKVASNPSSPDNRRVEIGRQK
jgi:outer membrane protein OmpA-like peptidoglycan-associated protein